MNNTQFTRFRNCPLCGNSIISTLKSLQYAMFDDSPLNKSYDLVSCKKCGFIFFDTQSKSSDFHKHYEQNLHYMKNNQNEPNIHEEDRYSSILSVLKDKISKASKVVDIGCGKGELCLLLKTQGHRNALAIDLLQSNVNFIKENGINAKIGSVEKLKLENNSVDVIILSHVIEHVIDLQNAMREIHRVIKNNGIIYAEVPSVEYGCSFKNAPMWDFIYEHVNYFSLHHLITLFERNGFSCIESNRKEIRNGNGIIKCIYSIFKKNTNTVSKNIQYYDINKSVLDIIKLNNLDMSEIEKTVKEKTPCYIWGISEYMQLLIEMTPIKECNIISFLDNSKYKQTKTINSIPIRSPDILEKESNRNIIIFPAEPYSDSMNKYLDKINFSGKRIII